MLFRSEDIAVRSRLGFGERDPAAVVGDIAGLVPHLVLIDQGPGVSFGLDSVEVEELRIAVVDPNVERRAIVGPLEEHRFEFLARSQIPFGLPLDHIQVVILVAPLVVGEEDAIVPGEERNREGGLDCRPGHGRGLTARGGDGIGVEDPRPVRGEQDLGLDRKSVV